MLDHSCILSARERQLAGCGGVIIAGRPSNAQAQADGAAAPCRHACHAGFVESDCAEVIVRPAISRLTGTGMQVSLTKPMDSNSPT